MSTSGSTDWTLNRDQAITMALRKLGVIPQGGIPTTAQVNDCVDSLQAIVKAFQADGMPLWKINSQSFTVVSGTALYTVGPSQTINCPKPLRVYQGFWTPVNGTNTPLTVYNRYDFNLLPQGVLYTGDPVNMYYQPLNVTGTITLWPTPANSTTVISFHYQSPYEDMDVAGNNFDFPSEWIMPIVTTLAWVMASEYGIPLNDRTMLQQEATYWHQYILSMGSEEGSIRFQPRNM